MDWNAPYLNHKIWILDHLEQLHCEPKEALVLLLIDLYNDLRQPIHHEEIGQKLGKQVAGLINIFNPEMVIIGGTLSLTGDYITQPIKTAVRKYSLNLVNKDSVIVTSKLKDKAGIIGACMLARSRMFED